MEKQSFKYNIKSNGTMRDYKKYIFIIIVLVLIISCEKNINSTSNNYYVIYDVKAENCTFKQLSDTSIYETDTIINNEFTYTNLNQDDSCKYSNYCIYFLST